MLDSAAMRERAAEGALSAHLSRVLFDEETLAARVAELGRELTRVYRGRDPLLVGILGGGVVFLADLMRAIDLPVEVDFVSASSYGADEHSRGTVTIHHDLRVPIAGRHVLLVEDVVDTGRTLALLREELLRRGAASLAVCALLDKAARRVVDLRPDFVGFACPDVFVVGYGLDRAGRYRNLPCIGELAREQGGEG
jgi:hypoxanthine phosphoribosyltransferase